MSQTSRSGHALHETMKYLWHASRSDVLGLIVRAPPLGRAAADPARRGTQPRSGPARGGARLGNFGKGILAREFGAGELRRRALGAWVGGVKLRDAETALRRGI